MGKVYIRLTSPSTNNHHNPFTISHNTISNRQAYHPANITLSFKMNSKTAVLGLIAAVSAIDIRLHNQRDCQGKASVACINVNPKYVFPRCPVNRPFPS